MHSRAGCRGWEAPRRDLAALDDELDEKALLVDHDELAGVVAAEPRAEIVLRGADRADPGDHAGRLGGLRTPRARGVVHRERHQLVAVVGTGAEARLVGAPTGHADQAGAAPERAHPTQARAAEHVLVRNESA